MRFMILLKSDESTEAGTMPSEAILAAIAAISDAGTLTAKPRRMTRTGSLQRSEANFV